MALPPQVRTFSTRRDVPLLDTSSTFLGAKSWCLALFRALSNTEATGTLGGTRNPNSVWSILRTSNSIAVAANNWADLAALVGNTNGNAHSWAVLENTTLGYQFLIDINNASGTQFRFCMTKIANPFSTGTTTTAPSAANEFQAGVYATGLGAITPPIWAGTLGGTYLFHYTTAEDGQFFTLMNRIGQLNFNMFFAVQKTENAHVNDTNNVFMWMNPASEDARGVPTTVTSLSSPNITGRSADGTTVFTESSGGRLPTFGNGPWSGGDRLDVLRNMYPAWKVEIGSLAAAGKSGVRGNFYDCWMVPIASGRIGQVYPSSVAPQYVLAADFLIPFVGAPPTL